MPRAALLAALLLAAPTAAAEPAGVRPVGADGKPLNLDFEAGDLRDWAADGAAFADQPVEGNVVTPRRPGQASDHQGRFWVGTFERTRDPATGTLTSAPFRVTHPWASFLIGGGPHPTTCVEIVAEPSGEVLHRASGRGRENLQREAVDLSKHAGKLIRVRIVDRHGGHWGHVNFDDFLFHDANPRLPKRGPVVEGQEAVAATDSMKHNGLTPEAAAAAMTVPEGFEVRLFAGEPDVHQPVAMALDDRGRLWVAEAYTYPKRHPHPGPLLPDAEKAKGDRIVVFEDADGDGKHDKRTVFQEGLNLVSGLEVGFGGVWVGAAPYLLFIPDKDGDDRPDAAPKVLLDGWGYQDSHETLNTFTWGPDGWLYGCHGVFTHSRVGRPGAPDAERTPINAGVWRYHPVKHVFEVFAHGTSNPWGLDYNENGDFFVEACVIPHCFHIVQGGRYNRQAGQHFNPYTYADIPTIADHRHYLGATPHGGNNRSDGAGGGHAHCGLMVYQGGSWPQQYHGQLFMGNIHGRRLNVDVPTPKGSGYTASHGKDFLLANDSWARFINLRYGPDGNVYLIDWYDKQACHHNDPKVWDRTNGRVFKIVYKGAKPTGTVNLAKCSDAELVAYQTHANEWYARHARRLLQERAAGGKLADATRKALEAVALESKDYRHRLRGMWTLAACEMLAEPALAKLRSDYSEVSMRDRDADGKPIPWDRRDRRKYDGCQHVEGWAYYYSLVGGTWPPDGQCGTGLGMTLRGASEVVRRHILSALLRSPAAGRWFFLTCLPSSMGRIVTENERGERIEQPVHDLAGDPLIPHLFWYALEPLAAEMPEEGLRIAATSDIPALLPFAARRVGALATPAATAVLTKALTDAKSPAQQLAYLGGLREAVQGKRRADAPAGWGNAYSKLQASADAEVRSLAKSLAVTFGDPQALAALRATLADAAAPADARRAALASLADAKDAAAVPLLQKLVADPAVRAPAVRALAAFDDPATAPALLLAYSGFGPAERRDAVNTLAARRDSARALLDAVARKAVPAGDVPAEVVRQLRNLGDADLDRRLNDVWGSVRETPAARKALIESWRKKIAEAPPPSAPQAELALGRSVFAKTCQQCHTLFGVGGKVGPDITGANRPDLGYVLENIFDPSAVIPKEYAATKLDLADGRVVTGIVKEETPRALTVVTATETLTVPAGEVEKRTPSPLSMMPDDVAKQLPESELRALVAYLRSPRQTPLRATPENAADFFNGKDLTNWAGEPKLWRVENGEIVGQTPGLKENAFLVSAYEAGDFRLTFQVKLTPDGANSGVQFRSFPLPDGEMKGPQADAGKGWWGKLYEERGRGLLWPKSGEAHVRPGEWNEYAIEAKGSRVRTFINGQPCVDLDDPAGPRRGVFGLQLHSGGATEVRFRGMKLEVVGK